MLTFKVYSFFGTNQFSSAEFASYEKALDYAEEQRKAMPRWYKKIQVVRKEEIIMKELFHTPDFSPST